MSTNEIDIVKLSINDTFYDWFLRTNQVIDYVNPINVYDVFAGAGILESRTGTRVQSNYRSPLNQKPTQLIRCSILVELAQLL